MGTRGLLSWLNNYVALLFTLLILLVAGPILESLVPGHWFWDALLIVVLVTAMRRIVQLQQRWWVTVGLGVPAVLGRVVTALVDEPSREIAVVVFVFTVLFMLHVICSIGRHVLFAARVNRDILAGAICLYLLLGLVWAIAYGFLMVLDPTSLNVPLHFTSAGQDSGSPFSILTYFSFVTLTTLGFGDISPVSPMARNLVWLEAVVGQLFVAITIARLVSLNVAHGSRAVEAQDDD